MISEWIDIWVESDFYSLDSEKIRINNYTLTRLGRDSLDISLDFNSPPSITQSLTEPDHIMLNFTHIDLLILGEIPPQLSER